MRRTLGGWLFVAGALAGSTPAVAYAQTWSVDLSAGRTVFDPLSVNLGTNNLAGSLRYDTRRETWIYGAAAAPLGDQAPLWGASGAGGRLLLPGSDTRRATAGLDVGAHGFLFRDAIVEQAGTGGTAEAIPFVRLSAGDGRVELRGGWRGHTLAYAGATEKRGVLETGARATYGSTVRVQGDARWVHAAEGTYPFMGASLIYAGAPFQLWAQTGKWLSDDLDDVAWSAGAGLALGAQSMVWASVRQESPDPLYWNAPRRTWTVGITRQLGRARPLIRPAPRHESGGVEIRVAVADVPAGALAIAGDFNEWRAVPMQREGREWVIRIPLAAGVYHYAFRAGDGEWFVPASIAGRRDDGMGGHVAVLVVS